MNGCLLSIVLIINLLHNICASLNTIFAVRKNVFRENSWFGG